MSKPEPMTTQTGLTMAVLVLDFEAETARASSALSWAREANEAAKVLRQLTAKSESPDSTKKAHS